jgi:hypothetical protein
MLTLLKKWKTEGAQRDRHLETKKESAMKLILSVLITLATFVCFSQPDPLTNKLFDVELLVKEAVSEAKEINDPRPLEVAYQNLKKIYSDSALFTSNNIVNTDEMMMRLHLEILNGCTHLKGWRLRDAESVYHYFQTNKIDMIAGLQEIAQRDSFAKGGDARDYAISRIYNDALYYVRFRLNHSNKFVSSNLRVIVDKLAEAELKKAILGSDEGAESKENGKQ